MVKYEKIGDIAILTVDNPPLNLLSHGVRSGLCEGVKRAGKDQDIKAIVLMCTGRTFIAGADISEFSAPIKEPRLRDIQQQIESSEKPVIAAMHGTALGGGFELALSCHWRIARQDAKFGLPEVNLGIIPGAGGTQRLPRLVGPQVALKMISSGNHYPADFGQENGLIDRLVDEDLRQAAMAFARETIDRRKPLRVVSQLDGKTRDVDRQIFADYRKSIARKAHGQLAPWKIVDCVETCCQTDFAVGDRFEQKALRQCLESPQHKALTYLFGAERKARKIPGLDETKPQPIRKAAVIGSGTMGGGIAMCFANAGIPVTVIDLSTAALDKGMAAIRTNYTTSVNRGSLSPEAMASSLTLITPSTDYGIVNDVDIIIEAAFEDLAVKTDIFKTLDGLAPSRSILATNTSSLDIDQIAATTSRPDKVIGTHFFSPANVMKLLENVRGAGTSMATIATAMALGKTLGKICVLAGNCDGFIGNRMFQFYNYGWEYLLEEGATPEQIDRAALDFGMAMGPVAVRDMVGLDVSVLVRKQREDRIPKEERISPLVERLVDMGRHGQKNGAGFYRYEGRTPLHDPEVDKLIESVAAQFGVQRRNVSNGEIMPRLLAPMVNEGSKILEEGIALRSGDIDVVLCHGYGFPKHLGGPMFWAQQYDLAKVVDIMEPLAERFGPRYAVSPLMRQLAATGKSFS